MALAAQTPAQGCDARFYYEPMLSAHPTKPKTRAFAGFDFSLPLWISSMTGGTAMARTINANMARACAEFDLGMGLGSCRPLLENRQSLEDFDVRALMPGRPLFANLGVAQIEELRQKRDLGRIHEVVKGLKADGLIIHVNPLQEWFQPGGDVFAVSPLETITEFLQQQEYPVMVKEVGHGMGPASLKALMQLNLVAIEFAAFGGTNFSVLEARRAGTSFPAGLSHVGHSAAQMVGFVQKIIREEKNLKCQRFIISGGVADVLQGHALSSQLPGEVLFGMASPVLLHARGEYSELRDWLYEQMNEYAMAEAYLRAKPIAQGSP